MGGSRGGAGDAPPGTAADLSGRGCPEAGCSGCAAMEGLAVGLLGQDVGRRVRLSSAKFPALTLLLTVLVVDTKYHPLYVQECGNREWQTDPLAGTPPSCNWWGDARPLAVLEPCLFLDCQLFFSFFLGSLLNKVLQGVECMVFRCVVVEKK
eukprot:RCo027018